MAQSLPYPLVAGVPAGMTMAIYTSKQDEANTGSQGHTPVIFTNRAAFLSMLDH